MKRPQFVFRPNLRDPAQRRAWQLLQAQPAGERSAYLAACILKSNDRAAVQKELRKVLKGTPMPAEYIVRSFNSPLVKLAMIDESMATRFFRLAGISDRAMQSQLLRLAKKRPAGFGGEEALDIMEDISPVLADLGDIWDSTMLRISTLSLLGLYLAQGYIKEQIGEEFDLSRWFE